MILFICKPVPFGYILLMTATLFQYYLFEVFWVHYGTMENICFYDTTLIYCGRNLYMCYFNVNSITPNKNIGKHNHKPIIIYLFQLD